MNETYRTYLHHPFHLRHWNPPDENMPIAFIPGRAQGNWEDGLIQLAATLWRQGHVSYLSIPGSDGSFVNGQRVPTGYPGWQVWHNELEQLGVPSDKILRTRGQGLHTRSETDDFVIQAKQAGLNQGLVLMNCHETLRVLAGALKACEAMNHFMVLYPVTPVVDWERLIYGSQGQLQLPRKDHIPEELKRVETYQKKGDLASFRQLDAYYRHHFGIGFID